MSISTFWRVIIIGHFHHDRIPRQTTGSALTINILEDLTGFEI